jgi:hypothetical protein
MFGVAVGVFDATAVAFPARSIAPAELIPWRSIGCTEQWR